MNKEELIQALLQHELNLFRFSVWATYNDNDLVYALCLAGEKPSGYEIHLCDVGGNSDVHYTYDYIDFCIEDGIDEFYDKTGYIL